MSEAWVFVLLGAIAVILGIRGSVRLTHRYLDAARILIPRERLLLGALVVVCWLITIVGAYFVVISARRIAGFDALEWSPFASIVLASAVLFIPAALDFVIERIARLPKVG